MKNKSDEEILLEKAYTWWANCEWQLKEKIIIKEYLRLNK
jgi:hypothetical protein